jgi:hypothetical protein
MIRPSGSLKNGGEGGIRTRGTEDRTTAFEAAAFNHSATSPLNGNAFWSARRSRIVTKGWFLVRINGRDTLQRVLIDRWTRDSASFPFRFKCFVAAIAQRTYRFQR